MLVLVLFSLLALGDAYCYCKTGQGNYCSGGSGISCHAEGRRCSSDNDCSGADPRVLAQRRARAQQEADEAARVLIEAEAIIATCSAKPCLNAGGKCVNSVSKRYAKAWCCKTAIGAHLAGTRCE